MKYLDEELVQLRLAESRKDFVNTKTGMYVEDDLIKFSECYIFENQISLMIPINFMDMDQNMAQMKYPYEKRPQIIKTNSEGDINLTFSFFQESVSVDIDRLVESISITLQLGNSSCHIFENGVINENGNLIGWCDYSSNSLNGKIYNCLMLTDVNENILLGMFNCPYNRKHYWNPIFFEIIKTVERKKASNGC